MLKYIIVLSLIIDIFGGWTFAYTNNTEERKSLKQIETGWSYDESRSDGPTHWGDNEEYKACNAKSQSPIDLKVSTFVKKTFDKKFVLNNYKNKPESARVINNGHSVQIIYKFLNDQTPTISGGPLKETYQFEQLHFHWGAKNDVGSEHFVNAKQYAMEAHLVHFNKKYGTFKDAMLQSDGLSVIGYLYNVKPSTPYMTFTKYLKKIKKPDTMVMLNKQNKINTLSELFGENISQFATYTGSLTTPPCSESVQWIVDHKTLYITPKEIAEFRNLIDSHDMPLVNNFRPLQSINDRKILITFN